MPEFLQEPRSARALWGFYLSAQTAQYIASLPCHAVEAESASLFFSMPVRTALSLFANSPIIWR